MLQALRSTLWCVAQFRKILPATLPSPHLWQISAWHKNKLLLRHFLSYQQTELNTFTGWVRGIFSQLPFLSILTWGLQRCQQSSCKHRPAVCQYLWRDGKQNGAHLPGRNLQSPQTKPMGDSHLPQLLWANFALSSLVSGTSVGSRKKHTSIFRHRAASVLISASPDSSDSHTHTCEARTENGDRGNHDNHLVGGSIALKLLFTTSLAVSWRKSDEQSKKRLFVYGSGLRTNRWKRWNQEKTMKYVSAWPFKSKLLVYPNVAIGKSELLTQERSCAKWLAAVKCITCGNASSHHLPGILESRPHVAILCSRDSCKTRSLSC